MTDRFAASFFFYNRNRCLSKTLFAMIRPGMQMRDVYRGQHRPMSRKLVEYGMPEMKKKQKATFGTAAPTISVLTIMMKSL